MRQPTRADRVERGRAAVDGDDLARHEGGLVAEQECDDGRDLLRRAGPLEGSDPRALGEPCCAALLRRGLAEQAGRHDAGRDGVDAHPERAPVNRCATCEADHAVLRRVVRKQVGRTAQTGDGGGGDDRATRSLRRVLPERRPQPEEDTAQVDRDDAVELVGRDLGKGCHRPGNAGVEVVEVDASVSLDGGAHVPVDVRLEGHVGGHCDSIAERARDLLGRTGVRVHDHHTRSFRGETSRGSRTDAAAAARDDRDPVREALQRHVSRRRGRLRRARARRAGSARPSCRYGCRSRSRSRTPP